MSNKSLQDLVKERKQQATDKNLHRKVELIVNSLGIHRNINSKESFVRSEFEVVFHDSDFTIKWHEYLLVDGDGTFGGGQDSTIIFKGKTVFEENSSGVIGYIPGEWEMVFENLYERAKHCTKQQTHPEQQHVESELTQNESVLRTRFGL